MKSPMNTPAPDNEQQSRKKHTYACKLFIQQVLCLVSEFPHFVTRSSFRSASRRLPLFSPVLAVATLGEPNVSTLSPSRDGACSSADLSGPALSNLLHPRNSGVRTQANRLSAGRSIDCQVAHVSSVCRHFPAREKACCFGRNAEVAKGCIAPPERSKCQSRAVVSSPHVKFPRTPSSPLTVRVARPCPTQGRAFLFLEETVNNKPEWEPQEIQMRDMLKGFFAALGVVAVIVAIVCLIWRFV